MLVVVFAEVPLPGRCLKPLVPYNDEAWLARLSAAMLRDTLDGLENVPADRWVVLADTDDEGREVLARHVPRPWTLARVDELDPSDGFIVAHSLAPAADLDALFTRRDSFVVTGEDARRTTWLYGTRNEGDASVARITLPTPIVVDTQPALDALAEELRKHHERAPRTGQLLMTS